MPAIDPKTFDVHEILAHLPDGCRLEIRPVIRPTHADFEVVVISRVSGEYRCEPKSQRLEDRIRDAVEEFRDLWEYGEEDLA